MARPKEFDRDVVLERAIGAFASHGYAGTSTEDLLKAMGISRQSLYDTYGDKRRLYLEALERYSRDSTAQIIEMMQTGGLEAALLAFAARPAQREENACLGVGATCEFGASDPEVRAATGSASTALLTAFETLIARGQAAGEMSADLDHKAAAQFLSVTLAGLKVAARGGAAPEILRNIVRVALRSLA